MDTLDFDIKIKDLELQLSNLKSIREAKYFDNQLLESHEFSFSELVDCKELQSQLDLFYDLVGLGIGIIDTKNTVLVSTGWQKICTNFHRKNSETCKRCQESDAFLYKMQNVNKPIEYKCKNGMWDTAFPIIIEGKTLAGIYFGQFFYDDEEIDYAFFEKQAEEFGFNKQDYFKVLKQVPIVSRQKIATLMTYYSKLAQSLANLGYQNILIKRTHLQERYIYQQKLIESEKKLKTIFDTIEVGIIITNEEGKIIDCNRKTEEFLGVVKGEFINQSYTEKELKIIRLDNSLLPPKEFASMRAINENKTVTDIRMGVVKNETTTLWFSANASPINLKGYGAVVSYVDITEVRNKEQILIESEAQFKNMFEKHASVMLLIEPVGGAILNANLSAAEFYGCTITELCGKNINDINGLQPEQVAAERLKAIEEKRNYFVFPHKLFSGGEKIVEVHSSPIIYHNTKILFSIIHDITERTIAEKALKNREEELQKQNIDKNRFISILGHDLKGPLTSIRALLDIITPEIRNYSMDEIEKMINMINSSVHNTTNLLEDILMWARSNSNNISFEPKLVTISSICTKVIESLKLIAKNKNIAIKYTTAQEINVFADSNMLDTILRNLISNAIKFTNRNGLVNVYAESNQSYVTITVSDNGVGISPTEINKLFDLSQKITSVGTENEKGTGLGLLLCKEFVEKHNGKIWVESQLGKGSDFKFEIPLFNS